MHSLVPSGRELIRGSSLLRLSRDGAHEAAYTHSPSLFIYRSYPRWEMPVVCGALYEYPYSGLRHMDLESVLNSTARPDEQRILVFSAFVNPLYFTVSTL